MAVSNTQLKEKYKERVMCSFWSFLYETKVLPDLDDQPHLEMANEFDDCVPEMYVGKEQRKKLYLAPRGTYKSSLAIAFIVYLILKLPNIRIVLVRATADLSQDMLGEITEMVTTNSVILEIFGDISRDAKLWNETKIITNLRTRADKDATISVHGTNKGAAGTHPDLVVMDDIINEKNYESVVAQKQARKKMVTTYPTLHPWSSLIVVGTRWAENDVYGWILEEDQTYIKERGKELEAEGRGEEAAEIKGKWSSYVRSAYLDQDRTIPYFPRLLGINSLADLKLTVGLKLFSSNYLNQPFEDGMKIFPSNLITHFSMDQWQYKSKKSGHPSITVKDGTVDRERLVRVYMTVDPAITDKTSSDFTGVVVNAVTAADSKESARWWILESHAYKLLPTELTKKLIYLIMVYEPDIVLVERAHADPEMIARIQTAINSENIDSVIMAYDSLRDESAGARGKNQRIMCLEPRFNQYLVTFRRGANDELENQIRNFPGLDHDDVIDALAMQRVCANPPRLSRIEEDQKIRDSKNEEQEELDSYVPNENNNPRLDKHGSWTGPGTTKLRYYT